MRKSGPFTYMWRYIISLSQKLLKSQLKLQNYTNKMKRVHAIMCTQVDLLIINKSRNSRSHCMFSWLYKSNTRLMTRCYGHIYIHQSQVKNQI